MHDFEERVKRIAEQRKKADELRKKREREEVGRRDVQRVEAMIVHSNELSPHCVIARARGTAIGRRGSFGCGADFATCLCTAWYHF